MSALKKNWYFKKKKPGVSIKPVGLKIAGSPVFSGSCRFPPVH
jgi:hypothetical protein